MFFSRVNIPEDAGYSSHIMSIFQTPYSLHQSIWKLFDDRQDRKRDFLYRVDKDGLKPVIYTVSEREPDQDRDLWHVESKEYAPRLHSGTELAFMLRVNPVVTKRDAQKKQHRHDVVMDMKMGLKEEGHSKKELPSIALMSQEAGWNWLTRRAEQYGFTVRKEQIRADGYRKERFKKTQGGRKIQFSILDFNGKLIVTDPVLFSDTLFKGVGPAKAFGCGLLLVKRG